MAINGTNRCRKAVVEVIDNGVGVQNLAELCEKGPGNSRKVSRRVYGTKRGCLYFITKLCSKVSITSRRYSKTRCKIFQDGKGEMVVEGIRSRPSPGTTVSLSGLFTAIPVRATSLSVMDLQDARDELLKISLANPSLVMTLKDVTTGTKLLQTVSSPTALDSFLIFCQCRHEWETFREVKGEFKNYKLSGLVSTETDGRVFQVLFVNRRPIVNHWLQTFVNDLIVSAEKDKRNQENKFPVFAMFLTCKPALVDMCFDSNTFTEFTDWNTVCTLVYQTIASFLESEGMSLSLSQEELIQSSMISSPQASLRTRMRNAPSPPNNVKSERARRRTVQQPTDKHEKEKLADFNPTTPPSFRQPEIITKPDTPVVNLTPSAAVGDRPRETLSPIYLEPLDIFEDDFVSSLPAIAPPHTHPTPTQTPPHTMSLEDEDRFTTPPPKSPSSGERRSLQNAPVLNHLHSAKKRLDMKRKEKGAVLEFPAKEKSSLIQMCSTPLFPANVKLLPNPDLSPITEFTTDPRQSRNKRKRDWCPEPVFEPKKTVLDDEEEELFSNEPFLKISPIRKAKDSGYETTGTGSRHITFSPDKSPLVARRRFTVAKDHDGVVPDTPDQVIKATPPLEDSFVPPTPVLERSPVISPVRRFTTDMACSPVHFTQLQERFSAGEEKRQHDHCLSKVEGGETLVPTPTFIAQSTPTTPKLPPTPTVHPPTPTVHQPCDSQDAMLSDTEISIGALIETEVETVTTTEQIEDFAYTGGCYECNTQHIKKRLDLSTPPTIQQPWNQLPQQPTYQIASPVAAASHITADCTAWNKPKITLPRRRGGLTESTGLDLRKWRSEIVETRGESAVDARKPRYNMKFLIDAHKFTKDVFNDLKVTGQIDSKFIGCVTSDGMVVMVDQHAAHERVRLECMLAVLYKDPGSVGSGVAMTKLGSPVVVSGISRADRHFVSQVRDSLGKIGFAAEVKDSEVHLTEIPTICFTDSGELNISIDVLTAAFREGLDQIRDSRGSNLSLPHRLTEYLHSRACHGAIRFGDSLSLGQCKALLSQLAVCDLPFQCAHGRPSFAPVIQLKTTEEEEREEGVREGLQFLKLRSHFV
eukprot:sb/3461400/